MKMITKFPPKVPYLPKNTTVCLPDCHINFIVYLCINYDYFIFHNECKVMSYKTSTNIYNHCFFPQELAVIFSHHQVCIKKKKGGHFLRGQK